MRLPPIRRLTVEDFKEQEKWIGRLLTPINELLQSLTVGLQNGVTFQDNLASKIVTIQFNNNSAELSSSAPIKFKVSLPNTPIGVTVQQVQDISNTPQSLSGAVFPTWAYDSKNGQIQITALSGLVANQTYKVTFLVI